MIKTYSQLEEWLNQSKDEVFKQVENAGVLLQKNFTDSKIEVLDIKSYFNYLEDKRDGLNQEEKDAVCPTGHNNLFDIFERLACYSSFVHPILLNKICVPVLSLNNNHNTDLILVHELIHLIQFHCWNSRNNTAYNTTFNKMTGYAGRNMEVIVSEGHAEFCSRNRFKYLLTDQRTDVAGGFKERRRYHGYELFRFIKSSYGPNEALKAGFTISINDGEICIDIANKRRKVKELLGEYKIAAEF